MSRYVGEINTHYGPENMSSRITRALNDHGLDLNSISLDDLAAFDQMHYGGLETTRKLAEIAGLGSGMRVLDIGAGIGGPARTLAFDFNCHVVGLDLSDEYIEAARLLTDKVGLNGNVRFQEGSALDLPFEDDSFDVVWSQNALMNIEDKTTMAREAMRVLRAGGPFVFEAIMSGANGSLDYPVYWAHTAEISFLEDPETFRNLLLDLGYEEFYWKDVSGDILGMRSDDEELDQDEETPLGIEVLYDEVELKGQNTMRGFETGALREIHGIFYKNGTGGGG